MFELLFGLIWEIIMFICTSLFVFIYNVLEKNGSFVDKGHYGMAICLGIMFVVFWIIGFVLIVRGMVKIIRNKKTEANGEECFGKILEITNTGCFVNGNPELEAKVAFYAQTKGQVLVANESIGFDRMKFAENDFVKVKYYKNDINLIEVIDASAVTIKIKQQLDEAYLRFKANTDKEDETVVIDGVEYVKKVQYVRKEDADELER